MKTANDSECALQGKSNHRRCHRMAAAMAEEAKHKHPWIPDWAGIAWIAGYYGDNYKAAEVRAAMGDDWWNRAVRLCRALAR
jgi:hypothetical protein